MDCHLWLVSETPDFPAQDPPEEQLSSAQTQARMAKEEHLWELDVGWFLLWSHVKSSPPVHLWSGCHVTHFLGAFGLPKGLEKWFYLHINQPGPPFKSIVWLGFMSKTHHLDGTGSFYGCPCSRIFLGLGCVFFAFVDCFSAFSLTQPPSSCDYPNILSMVDTSSAKQTGFLNQSAWIKN